MGNITLRTSDAEDAKIKTVQALTGAQLRK